CTWLKPSRCHGGAPRESTSTSSPRSASPSMKRICSLGSSARGSRAYAFAASAWASRARFAENETTVRMSTRRATPAAAPPRTPAAAHPGAPPPSRDAGKGPLGGAPTAEQHVREELGEEQAALLRFARRAGYGRQAEAGSRCARQAIDDRSILDAAREIRAAD